MINTAILDFDGTIFSDGVIDFGLLKEISSKYKEILLISNNSSIAQTTIESYLLPYLKYVLTPQVIAKAILQNTLIKTKICCSKDVLNYIKSDYYSSNLDIRNVLKKIALNSSNVFLKQYQLEKLAIIGKVHPIIAEKFINKYLLKQYTLVGMNKDKYADSLGIVKKVNLVGDSYDFKFDIGKTSFTFLDLLKNYCRDFNLNTIAVYGDNFQSDGKLADLLGVDYEKTIFGKSRFSSLKRII